MARSPKAEPAAEPADDGNVLPGKKGRPTPTRKEQEAAHRRPLVSKGRRGATPQARAQLATEREKARIGMANGDERYLLARDKGPQKRFARDFVDARFNVGEILLPMLVIVILTYFFPTVATYALLAIWVVILFVVIDCVILGFRVRRRLAEKFGAVKVERGIRWYVTMRALQIRPLRLPKPQVKRGEFPS